MQYTATAPEGPVPAINWLQKLGICSLPLDQVGLVKVMGFALPGMAGAHSAFESNACLRQAPQW